MKRLLALCCLLSAPAFAAAPAVPLFPGTGNHHRPVTTRSAEAQRYFDIHHTREDSIDKVNPRELELGAAAMAALVYLVDQHGL